MRNRQPVVSIIVPVYNGEKTLPRCVNSICRQNFTDYELLLLNDGSEDDSLKICQEFCERDERIRVIDKKKEGVSATRNRGIEEATGKYIQFIDCDDYVTKDYLEVLIKNMQAEQCDLIIAGYTRHKNGRIKQKVPKCQVFANLKTFSYAFFPLYNQCLISTVWNKLYKKEKIVEGFPIGQSLGEDLLFNLSYIKECEKIVVMEQAGYQYCIENKNSLAMQYREDKFEKTMELHKKVLAFCKESLDLKKEKQWQDITFLREIRLAMKYLVQAKQVSKVEKRKKLEEWIKNEEVRNAYERCEKLPKPECVLKILIRQKQSNLIYIIFRIFCNNSAKQE